MVSDFLGPRVYLLAFFKSAFSPIRPHQNDFVTSSHGQEAYNAAGRNLAGREGHFWGFGMRSSRVSKSVDRRQFLAATGGGLLAAAVPGGVPMKDAISGAAPASSKQSTASSSTKRKIPIGVFDPVYDKFSLDEMLEKV